MNPENSSMKNSFPFAFVAAVALGFASCESPDEGQGSKELEQLERQAAEAVERQRQLELELADQKLAAELEAIERERIQIEDERFAMQSELEKRDAVLAAELERRQNELAERERRMVETQQALDARQQELTGLEQELEQRELEQAGREPIHSLPTVVNFNSGPATGDYDNFYEPLSDHGSWFDTTDYGYVFQPTIVRDVSWRPYTRGRWAFTDQGWTWVSSEPFGWACYHYGRWALLHNVGWVWVPGDEWAPAWVTWRESPGHVGWAPLPPETLAWRGRSWDSSVEVTFGIGSSWFSFVAYEHFGSTIQTHCLPVSRNLNVWRHSENITRYQVDNQRVFVGGPRYQKVSDRIGRPFPIHHLKRNQGYDYRRNGNRMNNHFSGRNLEVIAPRMDSEWNAALRPNRVRRDLGDVRVERSRELPDDVRKHFRERRVAEALTAEKVVQNAGGREGFDRLRTRQLEENRERDPRRTRGNDPNLTTEQSQQKLRPTLTPNFPEGSSRDGREGRDRRSEVRDPIPTLPKASGDLREESASRGSGTLPLIDLPRQREERVERRAERRNQETPNNPAVEVERRSRPEALEENSRRQREAVMEQRKAELERKLQEQRATQDAQRTQRQEALEKRKAELAEQAALGEAQMQQENEQRQRAEQVELTRRAQREEAQRQQQEQMQRQQAEQNEAARRTQQAELLSKQQEQQKILRQQQEESARLARLEQTKRQQQEEMQRQNGEQREAARRAKQEQARRAQLEQQEKIRQQREEMERQKVEQEEVVRRAQQEEARRMQQEELQRRQQEQQEMQRQQAQQEEARRVQQEQAQRRQQQEEMQRQQAQQEEARRAQQEQAQRRQQEEIQRQQAQREEMARRAQQEEAQRQQQQEIQRQQQEQLERMRQQQEEAVRQQQERAQKIQEAREESIRQQQGRGRE